MDTKRKFFVVIGTVAVLGAAVAGGSALFFSGNEPATSGIASNNSSTQSSSSSSGSTATTTPSTNSSQTYKDGTYTANTTYGVPHGGENSITTELTIKNGKITAVKASDNYTDYESQQYVDSFEQALSSAVVGQSLADVSPSYIGGASLTTVAFDETLDTIRNDAQA
jgi:uncharacterized protein with FMN-binding domain